MWAAPVDTLGRCGGQPQRVDENIVGMWFELREGNRLGPNARELNSPGTPLRQEAFGAKQSIS